DRSGHRLGAGHDALAHSAPDEDEGKQRHPGDVDADLEAARAHVSKADQPGAQVKRIVLRRFGASRTSKSSPKQGARRMAGLPRRSVVAIDTFASLVPLLRFERQ